MLPVGPGNHYDSEDWPCFLAGINGSICPQHPFAAAVDAFTETVSVLWCAFLDGGEYTEELNEIEIDDVVFRSFCSIVGHGVGLWDGEIMPEDVGIRFSRVLNLRKVDAIPIEEWISEFSREE